MGTPTAEDEADCASAEAISIRKPTNTPRTPSAHQVVEVRRAARVTLAVMLTQTFIYVIETLVNLFVLAALTRFYAQAFRAPFRNPIAQFIVALTDWAVKPLRRVLPSIMGLDSASFVLAWLTLIVLWWVILMLMQMASTLHPMFWPLLAGVAIVKLIKLSLYLLIGVVIVQAVLSWFSPYHPVRPFFDALCRPFLRPFQAIIPPIGRVDLSPLFLLIVVQVLLMLPVQFLDQEALGMVRRLALA
jgi:YggT family protein